MGKIFAGLLFVFLHFKINGFDLLPDFVGYLLIWRGMKSVPECTSWQTGWAAAAAVASVAILGVSLVGIRFPGVLGSGVSLVMIFLQLAMTFDIVRGVEELEQVTDADLRADWLRKSWFVWISCVVTFYVCRWLIPAAAAIPTLLTLAASICYLVGVYKAWRGYDAWRSEPPIL